jgi:excisionase family DNA binding protein
MKVEAHGPPRAHPDPTSTGVRMPKTQNGTGKQRAGVTPTTHNAPTARQSPVLAGEPFRHLLTTLDDRIAIIMHLAPNSDLASATAAFRADLDTAMRQASEDSYILTVPEVAQRLRISEEAVRWNIRQGYIEKSKVGRQYRITRDALERFVSSSQTPNRASH